MKLLVMNGPNLNMLGIREPDIYGKQDYQALMELVQETCDNLGVELETYQSNHEGDLVDRIQMAYGDVDGIVIPTEWAEFSALDFDQLKTVVRRPVLFDLRNVYHRGDVEAAGFEYHGTGV